MDQTGNKSVPALHGIFACRVCCATTGKLYWIEFRDLKHSFYSVTGIQVKRHDGLPQYICYVCCGLLRKAAAFRKKCHSMQSFLLSLTQTQIQPDFIEQINLSQGQLLNRTKIVQISVGGESGNNSFSDLQNNPNDKDLEINLNLVKLESDLNSVGHSDDELITENCFNDCEDNKHGLIPEINQHQQADLKNKKANDKGNTNPYCVKMIRDTDIAVVTDPHTKMLYIPKEKILQVKKKLISIDKEFQLADKELENNLNSINHSDDGSGTDIDFDDSEENEYDLTPEKKKLAVTTRKSKRNIGSKIKKVQDFLKDKKIHICDKSVRKKTGVLKENESVKKKTRVRQETKSVKKKTGVLKKSKSIKKKTVVRKKSRKQNILAKGEMEFKKKYNFDIISFSKEEQIKNMLEKKNSDRYKNAIYKCEDCCAGFQYEDKYNNHKVHHDSAVSGNFECEVCKMKFHTKKHLSNHVYVSHKCRYTCKTCGQSFSNRTHCKDHYLSHSGGATYQCQYCPANYKTMGSLVDHVRFHHGSIHCEICQTILTDRGLVRHMRTAHRQTYKCQTCERKFNDSNALEKHIQTSPNSLCNPNCWACTKCGDNFSSERLYNEHIELYHRRATGLERKKRGPYKPRRSEDEVKQLPGAVMCELCTRIFPNEMKLKLHMRIHTGEKPFQCELCPKRFRLRSGLQAHIRTHTGERPYECTECSKAFGSQTNLQRHHLVHSKLRPYACHICNKTYQVAGAVKIHIRTAHMNEPAPPRIRRKKGKTNEIKGEEAGAENEEVKLEENEVLDGDGRGRIDFEEKASDNEEEMPMARSDGEGQSYYEEEMLDDYEEDKGQVELDGNEQTGNEGEEDWEEYREEIIVDQYDDDNDS